MPFECSAEALERAELWNLVTNAGRVDVLFKPSGTQGYDDLARSARVFTIFDIEVLTASLEDILRSKQAADRPQDRQDVEVLREMIRSGKRG